MATFIMNTIFAIIDWLHSIPNVIWSGVIASLITLSGVFISNRNNTNRLILQLDHDATQKEADRKAAIRREVYLEVAEQAVKASNYLATISNTDIANVNIASGLHGFFIASAKLMAVADMKTTLTVSQLSSMYSSLALEVTPDVFKIGEYNNWLNIYQKQWDETELEIKRILAAQRAFNELPQPKDQTVFSMLQLSFKQQSEISEKISKEQQGYHKKRNIATIELAKSLLPKLSIINDKQMEVLVSIREELGLMSDMQSLKDQMELIRAEQHGKVESLISFLDTKISKDS